MLKIVLDTNVLVSSVISKARSRELQCAIRGEFRLITSDEILSEFVEGNITIHYKKERLRRLA